MKSRPHYLFLPAILFLVLLLSALDLKKEIEFTVPKGWPKPVYSFTRNKPNIKSFELGRALFYDPILSRDSSISCESCHLSFTAFSHPDHRVSHGIAGLVGNRNAPSLVNLAWSPLLMWDGKARSIEEQAVLPITNPIEMDLKMADAVKKLQRSFKYRKMFFAAFKDSTVNEEKLLKALAMFTSNLVSYHSKYDSVVQKIKGVSFTESEQRGYMIFKQQCASCHKEPLFTDHSFRINGLPADTFYRDAGRMKVTHNKNDSLKFRVPTLRNIEFSGPYFHDGRVNKLKEALKHYAELDRSNPLLDSELRKGSGLDKQNLKDLTSFLRTLTDKYYLYNSNYRPNN